MLACGDELVGDFVGIGAADGPAAEEVRALGLLGADLGYVHMSDSLKGQGVVE